ncbi:MAG: lipoate--protein ligase family protein [Pleurocapsa sp. SU_5_0]|nr:lipoate--protein ligase family protein [Pleurocapsa sp. SU_5_0]NJR47681.1 lipoate--protein ligase family protein [Hyellaceae cyanobacterium CSU_1_1]
MNSKWRYIPPMAASGVMQMAIDRYLLEQHRQGKHPPTLRLYTWQPAAISLGYHQPEYPDFWHDLTWQGQPLDIIRRPTGGRAVLHQGDLTYAIVTSIAPGKRLEVYQYICQFLITGWRSLGVDLNYGTATKEYIQQQNCFATATGADLVTTAGNKVIGSAQLRRGKALLQHGSMILNTDKQLYRQVFKTDLAQNLCEVIPQSSNPLTTDPQSELTAKIVERLVQAASAIFKIDLVKQPLSTKEWQDIANTRVE